MEWTGFNTLGAIVSRNGNKFELPKDITDCRQVATEGDIFGYEGTNSKMRVTFVDEHTVRMVRV